MAAWKFGIVLFRHKAAKFAATVNAPLTIKKPNEAGCRVRRVATRLLPDAPRFHVD
jgi:hypothetical protein